MANQRAGVRRIGQKAKRQPVFTKHDDARCSNIRKPSFTQATSAHAARRSCHAPANSHPRGVASSPHRHAAHLRPPPPHEALITTLPTPRSRRPQSRRRESTTKCQRHATANAKNPSSQSRPIHSTALNRDEARPPHRSPAKVIARDRTHGHAHRNTAEPRDGGETDSALAEPHRVRIASGRFESTRLSSPG